MGTDRRLWTPAAAGLAVVASASAPALGTWSILIADTRTGEIALGSATCVTRIDLRENTAIIVTGVGAATAQSFVDQTGRNRVFVRDGFLSGMTPGQIVTALEDFDGAHQTRQYGMVDVLGNAATFSGAQASEWKGGVTGRIEQGRPGPEGDLVYAVQGNILLDAEVVLRAEIALLDTPGDLADKLMASMEAARFWGGDGRCSCTTGGPTDCDVPPPTPFKSAHVGYMLISRPGDTDDCPGIYAGTGTPAAMVAMDLDNDGERDDLVIAPESGQQIARFLNATPAGSTLPALHPLEPFLAGGNAISGMASGDVTGDGVEDLVLAMNAPAQIAVFEGVQTEDGLDFAPGQTVPLAPGTGGVTVADLDGQGALDVAVALPGDDEVAVLLSNADGVLGAPASIAITGRPERLTLGDFDDDNDPDLAVTQATGSGVALLINDGAGAFTFGESIATPAGPVSVHAAHLNPGVDDAMDLVVSSGSSSTLTTLIRQAGDNNEPFARTDYPTNQIGRGVDAIPTDADGDGTLDILAVGVLGRAQVFTGDGQGVFAPLAFANLRISFPAAPTAVDLTHDGLPDLVFGSAQSPIVRAHANRGGVMSQTIGCGGGDYYMELNTRRQNANGPEPVDLLREQFEAWAADQVGRPDGVVSQTTPLVRTVEGFTKQIRVELRDREGTAVAGPVLVEAFGAAGIASVEGVEDQGGGVYLVTVRGEGAGSGEIRVTADDGVSTVELVPAPRVTVGDARADTNDDGVVSIDDIQAFIDAFLTEQPAADLNADGFYTPQDIDLFVQLFLGA